jgi:hypothetical protein
MKLFYISRAKSWDDDCASLHLDVGKLELAIFFIARFWTIDCFRSQNFKWELHVGPFAAFWRD